MKVLKQKWIGLFEKPNKKEKAKGKKKKCLNPNIELRLPKRPLENIYNSQVANFLIKLH